MSESRAILNADDKKTASYGGVSNVVVPIGHQNDSGPSLQDQDDISSGSAANNEICNSYSSLIVLAVGFGGLFAIAAGCYVFITAMMEEDTAKARCNTNHIESSEALECVDRLARLAISKWGGAGVATVGALSSSISACFFGCRKARANNSTQSNNEVVQGAASAPSNSSGT